MKQQAVMTKDLAKLSKYFEAAQVIGKRLDSSLPEYWRTPFQAKFLDIYHRLGEQLVEHSEWLVENREIPRFDVSRAVLHDVFTIGRPDHAFNQEPLRWGFGLTEPMVTKTLARLLSNGSGEIRARRISAFLQAVGVSEGCASLDALQQCRIVAEQDHIDLKLVWANEVGRDVVVIVEAKFGHKITKGQLSSYRKAVQSMHGVTPLACILLTLDDSVCVSLIGKQRSVWKQVDWRDVWLRFERLRPVEHDPALLMFLHTLWCRTGCLTQEDRHGRI